MNTNLRLQSFLSRCVVDANGCWLWTGMVRGNGYGSVKRDGKQVFAHRYSYMLHKGEIGDLLVLHKCDVRLCVNPDHLFLGTQLDNQRDMKAKGRHVHGEKSPHAKLKEIDIFEMYDLYEQGVGTPTLGRMFGVTKRMAWLIVHGRNWTHLYQARYGTSRTP